MLIGNKNDLDPHAKFDDLPKNHENLTTGIARVPYEKCEQVQLTIYLPVFFREIFFEKSFFNL